MEEVRKLYFFYSFLPIQRMSSLDIAKARCKATKTKASHVVP